MLGSIDGGIRSRGGIDGITGVRNLVIDRRVSTPRLLQLGMVVACLPVVALAVAVHVGLTRNDDAVQTVGEDATQGITVAQRIKLNLAELDAVAVGDLLVAPPLDPGGFPADYNAKRTELHENLVAAAARSPGAAYEQTLANLDYALGHYHALLADSFVANANQDPATALAKYDTAHQVMSDTLLVEADRFDKANTYVLNDTYRRQTDNSAVMLAWIGALGAALVAVLVGVQLYFARLFRRILNPALVAATVVAAVAAIFAVSELAISQDELAEARDNSFDSVHQLARARAVTVMARQSQGHFLIEPTNPDEDSAAFQGHMGKLFRLPLPNDTGVADPTVEDAIDYARRGRVPSGSGGYLALVVRSEGSPEGSLAASDAVKAFGDYLASDQAMRDQVRGGSRDSAVSRFTQASEFDALADTIDKAQDVDQRDFDEHVDNAETATEGFRQFNVAAAAVVAVLILVAFFQRLREYHR